MGDNDERMDNKSHSKLDHKSFRNSRNANGSARIARLTTVDRCRYARNECSDELMINS